MDETKRCISCGLEKPATREFFTPHTKGIMGLHPRCKFCRALDAREWYAQNSKKHRKTVSAYRARMRALMQEKEQRDGA